jgi:hypothetical protein
MKTTVGFIAIIIFFAGCSTGTASKEKTELPLIGSWKLITGTVIQKGDTTVTDYTNNKSFIKIISETHFAFLLHDLKKGKDSSSAAFVAGGGRCYFSDSSYTEHLEFCSDRQAEGHDFTFTVSIKADTLVQSGIEKIEETGVSRLNIEKYARIKK